MYVFAATTEGPAQKGEKRISNIGEKNYVVRTNIQNINKMMKEGDSKTMTTSVRFLHGLLMNKLLLWGEGANGQQVSSLGVNWKRRQKKNKKTKDITEKKKKQSDIMRIYHEARSDKN